MDMASDIFLRNEDWIRTDPPRSNVLVRLHGFIERRAMKLNLAKESVLPQVEHLGRSFLQEW